MIKLYAADAGNPLFANDPARERAVLAALSGTGMVPPLVQAGTFEGRQWLSYAHINGQPWRHSPGHVAQVLGRLHDCAPPAGLPPGVNGSLALEAQVAGHSPAVPGWALAGGLAPAGACAAGTAAGADSW